MEEGVREFDIVRLRPEDWEAIRDLRIKAVTDDPYAFSTSADEIRARSAEQLKQQIQESVYMGVRRGSELVGVVTAVPEKQAKVRHIANVYGMSVAKEVRGRGFGTKLLRALFAELRKEYPHIIKLELSATLGNEAAVRLYKRVGFVEVGILHKELFIDGRYYDEMQMEIFIRE